MRGEAGAVRVMLDLYKLPSRARVLRSAELPGDVDRIFAIAAGEPDATDLASNTTGERPDTLRAAAAFFIEQIILEPHADAYHLLGGGPDTPLPLMRRNMALLLHWLHPDHQGDRILASHAGRIVRAWETVRARAGTMPTATPVTGEATGAKAGAKAGAWSIRRARLRRLQRHLRKQRDTSTIVRRRPVGGRLRALWRYLTKSSRETK